MTRCERVASVLMYGQAQVWKGFGSRLWTFCPRCSVAASNEGMLEAGEVRCDDESEAEGCGLVFVLKPNVQEVDFTEAVGI